MPVLRNSRHEKFALIVAKGKTRSEAYREVTGSAKNADANADNWLNTPGVRERIAELKEANSRKSTLTREQIIEFLCKAVTASAANVEADSSLVQSAEFIDGKPVKRKIPDKIAAVRELVRICGWAQPARLELSARDTLADFIASIREAPRQHAVTERVEDNGGSARESVVL